MDLHSLLLAVLAGPGFLVSHWFLGESQGLCAQEEMQTLWNFALVLAKSHFKVNNLFTWGPGSEHPLMAHAGCLVV